MLGLRMNWQEKVLPSAANFSDCLHQARAAEEQERQLNELYQPKSSESARPAKSAEGSAQRRSEPTSHGSPPEHSTTPGRSSKCWKCGSTCHQLRDCPQRQPPSETPWRGARTGSNAAVKAARVQQRAWRNGATGSGVSGRRQSSYDFPSHISLVPRWMLSLDLLAPYTMPR